MSTKTVAMRTHSRRSSSGWLTCADASAGLARTAVIRRARDETLEAAGPEPQPGLEAVGERQARLHSHQGKGGGHLQLRVEDEGGAAHDVAGALAREVTCVVDLRIVGGLERVGRVAVAGEAGVS